MDEKREGTIDEILQDDESMSFEAQLWGKNSKRTEALRDLWFKDMTDFANEKKVPAEAREEMVFSMAVNSLLDMIMESVSDDLALELSFCFDHLLGVFIANKRYGVDIFDAAYQSISKLNRDDYKTDEEFERAVNEREEKWWTVGKQLLSGRSPNDVIIEALSRYGLNG